MVSDPRTGEGHKVAVAVNMLLVGSVMALFSGDVIYNPKGFGLLAEALGNEAFEKGQDALKSYFCALLYFIFTGS